MPIISMTAGPIETEKKTELISRLTEAAVSVTGIPEDHFTVLLNEMNTDNIGLGGKSLSRIMKK